MAEIEHIVFDLSEVLMRGIMSLSHGSVEAAIRAKGFEDSGFLNNQIHNNFFANSDLGLTALFKGEISEMEFFFSFIKRGGYPLSISEMAELTRKNFREYSHSRQLIERLKTEGYNLVILSDHAGEWVNYIEPRSSFLHLFDKKIYSFDSGHIKSEPEAFEYALEKGKVDPKKALFVDDMNGNLDVAKKVGIANVHAYRGYQDLVWAFNDLGVRGFN